MSNRIFFCLSVALLALLSSIQIQAANMFVCRNQANDKLLNGIKYNHLDDVKQAITEGAELNLREYPDSFSYDCEYENDAAVYLAVKLGHLSVVELLLESKASVNIPGSDNQTPLSLSVHEVCSSYMHGFCDDSVRRFYADEDSFKITYLLLSAHDLDVSSCAPFFARTPLHVVASSAGFNEVEQYRVRVIIQKMIERGFDINKQDSIGTTPLMCAAELGQKSTVAQLIWAGADISLKDLSGKTAFDYAQEAEKRSLLADPAKAAADLAKEKVPAEIEFSDVMDEINLFFKQFREFALRKEGMTYEKIMHRWNPDTANEQVPVIDGAVERYTQYVGYINNIRIHDSFTDTLWVDDMKEFFKSNVLDILIKEKKAAAERANRQPSPGRCAVQ